MKILMRNGIEMHKTAIDIPVADFRKLRQLALDADTTMSALIRGMIKARVNA